MPLPDTGNPQNNPGSLSSADAYVAVDLVGAQSDVELIAAPGAGRATKVFSILMLKGDAAQAANINEEGGSKILSIPANAQLTTQISYPKTLVENRKVRVTCGAAGAFVVVGYSILNV